MSKPTRCRIVEFVGKDGKTVRPAIITEVISNTLVNLRIFRDGAEGCYVPDRETSIAYNEDGEPTTWHWPARN